MKESIKSPYVLPRIETSQLQQIKQIVHANSMMMVTSDYTPNHDCKPETCNGHLMNFDIIGFSPQQIVSIAEIIADNNGLKLVKK